MHWRRVPDRATSAAGAALALVLALTSSARGDGNGGPGAPQPAPQESPPSVGRAVRALLAPCRDETIWLGDDPRPGEIAALGRDAIPELLRALEPQPRGAAPPSLVFVRVAGDALARLVTDDDLPRLAPLVTGGAEGAARALRDLRTTAVRDVLVEAVRAGFATDDVADSLRPWKDDAVVQEALAAWIEDHGAGRPVVTADGVRHTYGAGPALGLLDAAGPRARAALRTALASPDVGRNDVALATKLALAGGKDGVERLVGVLGSATDVDLRAADAGRTLNGIVGRRAWAGDAGPAGGSGNLAEASAAVRAWWDASRAALAYDPVTRNWFVGEVPAPFALPAARPEVANGVRAILAGRADACVSGFVSQRARRVADLGRTAVPALAALLREGDPWSGSVGSPSAEHDAAVALRLLRTDDDVPLLAALLSEGRLVAAEALRGCRDPRARAALVDVLARGFDAAAVVDTVELQDEGPDLVAALRAWLATGARHEPSGAARLVERMREPDERPFLREVLAAEGVDAGTRCAAACALERMGDADAIPALIRIAADAADAACARPAGAARRPLLTRSSWAAHVTGPGRGDPASRAADRLDSVFGERIRASGAPDGQESDALATYRARWDAVRDRLRFDGVRRVWTTEARAADDAPAPPDPLVAKVRSAGARSRRPDDTPEREIAALGRAAIPALVAVLREAPPWTGSGGRSDEARFASGGLQALATDADRDLVASLVAEGRLGLASWLAFHRSDAGRDALVGAVRRGFATHDVLVGLRPYAAADAVVDALAGWAERGGACDRGEARACAEVLAAGVAAGDETAAEAAAARLLARPMVSTVRARLAASLAGRGVKASIPALIDLLAGRSVLSADDADAVVEVVRRIVDGVPVLDGGPLTRTGRRIGTGPEDVLRAAIADALREAIGSAREDAPRRPAVGPDVVAKLRAWWTANAARLRFDATSGTWSVVP